MASDDEDTSSTDGYEDPQFGPELRTENGRTYYESVWMENSRQNYKLVIGTVIEVKSDKQFKLPHIGIVKGIFLNEAKKEEEKAEGRTEDDNGFPLNDSEYTYVEIMWFYRKTDLPSTSAKGCRWQDFDENELCLASFIDENSVATIEGITEVSFNPISHDARGLPYTCSHFFCDLSCKVYTIPDAIKFLKRRSTSKSAVALAPERMDDLGMARILEDYIRKDKEQMGVQSPQYSPPTATGAFSCTIRNCKGNYKQYKRYLTHMRKEHPTMMPVAEATFDELKQRGEDSSDRTLTRASRAAAPTETALVHVPNPAVVTTDEEDEPIRKLFNIREDSIASAITLIDSDEDDELNTPLTALKERRPANAKPAKVTKRVEPDDDDDVPLSVSLSRRTTGSSVVSQSVSPVVHVQPPKRRTSSSLVVHDTDDEDLDEEKIVKPSRGKKRIVDSDPEDASAEAIDEKVRIAKERKAIRDGFRQKFSKEVDQMPLLYFKHSVTNCILVQRVPKKATKDDIINAFTQFGEIKDVFPEDSADSQTQNLMIVFDMDEDAGIAHYCVTTGKVRVEIRNTVITDIQAAKSVKVGRLATAAPVYRETITSPSIEASLASASMDDPSWEVSAPDKKQSRYNALYNDLMNDSGADDDDDDDDDDEAVRSMFAHLTDSEQEEDGVLPMAVSSTPRPFHNVTAIPISKPDAQKAVAVMLPSHEAVCQLQVTQEMLTRFAVANELSSLPKNAFVRLAVSIKSEQIYVCTQLEKVQKMKSPYVLRNHVLCHHMLQCGGGAAPSTLFPISSVSNLPITPEEHRVWMHCQQTKGYQLHVDDVSEARTFVKQHRPSMVPLMAE